MPVERAIPLSLSGAEIKKAILDKLASVLNRQCHLNDNIAYDGGFQAEVSVIVKVKNLGQVTETEHEVKVDQAEDPEEFSALEASEAKFSIEGDDPNKLRIETGQDVPVVTKDNEGKDVIKGVKYARR